MTIIPSIKKDYLVKLAKNGKRIDGRKFDEYRDIKIEVGVVKKAEGSARVRIGNTQVIAGIKMDVGEPYPDSPDSGVMTTAAELIPMASPDFEAGPPRENAIELARVVDRGIRESDLIDVDKLCIEPGEKVWIVFIDIHVLDYDGNLFDAASLASLAALMTAKVPISRLIREDKKLYLKKLFEEKIPKLLSGNDKPGSNEDIDLNKIYNSIGEHHQGFKISYEKLYEIPGVNEVIRRNENNDKKRAIAFEIDSNGKINSISGEEFLELENVPLPLKEPPISCTSVKFNGVVVMDPSLDEEEIAEARLTVATDKNGDIRAMQKGLNGSFTVEEIKKVIKASTDNGKKIREQLYKSVGK